MDRDDEGFLALAYYGAHRSRPEESGVLKDSFRKLMVYVGLTEDDYDEFGRPRESERPFVERPEPDESPWATTSVGARSGAVSVLDTAPGASGSSRPLIRPAQPSSAVRPITTLAHDGDVDVVVPTTYEESKRIADDLRARRALVINLATIDSELGRRIIDFSAGVVYTLSGKITKIGPHVYLLVPPNVRVSPESIERLRHQNFRPSSF